MLVESYYNWEITGNISKPTVYIDYAVVKIVILHDFIYLI